MEKVEMKRNQSAQERVTVCVATTLLFMAGSVFAQASKLSSGAQHSGAQQRSGLNSGTQRSGPASAVRSDKSEKSESVEIKRMPPPNKTAMARTPEYNYNVQTPSPKVNKRPREWALFEVKYETGAKWTDELVFDFYVMAKGKTDEGKEAFSFYTTKIRYVDIPRGEHMSCAAIAPSLVERYGEPVAVALEITGKDGKIMDSKSETIMPFPKEWWKDSKVLDNPTVTRRNGMVDRSKTPFALVNPDDYEVVQ